MSGQIRSHLVPCSRGKIFKASVKMSSSSMEPSFPPNTALIPSSSSISLILRLITETTGLRFACVGLMRGEKCTAIAVLDRLGLAKGAGDELQVANEICSELRDCEAMVVTGKASDDQRFRHYPMHRLYGLESCMIIPLYRDGRCFGMLCALDPVPEKASDPKILAAMAQFAELISLQMTTDHRLEDSLAPAQERSAATSREQPFEAFSHDLHMPLAFIISGADVLLGKSLDQDARSIVERMLQSGHRLSNVIKEATVAVFSRLERRQEFLLCLQERLHGIMEPDQIIAAGMEILGRYLHVHRCGYVEADEDGESARFVHEWNMQGTAGIPVVPGAAERLIRTFASKPHESGPFAINDSQQGPHASDPRMQDICAAIGSRAMVCAPLIRFGHVVATLYLAQDAPHNWTEEERLLARDVAERIRAAAQRARVEHERNRAEELLREGMIAARMVAWEWEIASSNVTLSENAALILGCSMDRMESILQRLHPDDATRLQAVHAQAIERKSGYREVLRFTRPDTRQLIWIDIHAKIRYDKSGRPMAMHGVMVDVSDRMRAQSELAQVNQMLRDKVAQLENARARQAFQLRVADALRETCEPGMILSRTCMLLGEHLGVSRVLCGDYDNEKKLITFHSNYTDGTVGAIEGAYPAAIFGEENFASLERGQTWISNDMAHDPCTACQDIRPAFEALDIYASVVVPLSRRGVLIACLFINASEPRKWTEDEIKLIEDVAERTWNAVERVRVEEALRQADRSKDQFLAMLAHELRNPLAPISSAAQLLKHAGADPARIRNISDIIARQVSHMTGLVNDLLDVSRVTSGMITLNKEEVDIRRVVADAVEQVRPLIDARHHDFTVRLSNEPVYVLGDYKRLVQVLANLLSNAAKYTPSGGRIQVMMENDQDRVALHVVDNGIGMPPELMPNVFDLFTQGARTPDRSQGGLGLGLTLVKNLVELHGGRVKADSKGPGAGSTFIAELPRMVMHADVHDLREREKEPAAPRVQRPLRLIVVDDNADAAEALAMLLEMNGYQVSIEHDPRKALERIGNETFDACLLDIGLPGMDGNELARRLRSMPETRHALLIAITGYGQQYDRQKSMEAGFDEYFVKPVDPVKLIGAVRGLHSHYSE